MKRNKLKLGSVVFEFKEIFVDDIKIDEIMEMRYNRQDNTDTDKLKFDNLLKMYDWKWDFPHIAAFLFVGSVSAAYLYLALEDWFYENFPAFIRNPKVVKNRLAGAFVIMFDKAVLPSWWAARMFNFLLIQFLVEFCYFFNILC